MKKLSIVFLLLATGCAHELTAPLSDVPVTSMASYFWTGTEINFKDDSTGVITDQITFGDSSIFLLAKDADANGKLRTTIACTISPDTVFAENFVLGSVLDLDNGSYFSQIDNDTLIPHVLSAAVISGDGTAYVATDSGVWSASATGRFTYVGISNIPDIDALALSEGDSIFAATRSGKIWMFDPHSTSIDKWSLFQTQAPQSGAITALACDISSLYALVNGSVYQFVKHGYSWSQITFLGTTNISAIRANVNLNSAYYLALGTTDGTIGGYPVNGGSKFQQSLSSSGEIYDFASASTSLLSVATDSGIFQGGQTGPYAQLYNLSQNKHTTSLVYDPSGNMYFISEESVYSAPSNGSTSASLIPNYFDGTPLKLLNESSNSYLLTNKALYQHTSSTGWDSVPGFPRSYYPNLQGGLLLLKSNPEVDSSWRAGTLVTSGKISYPITGRLLSRLDSLVISGKSYSDVLVVRYSHELAAEMPDTKNVPYWVIYYQRGRGPIMFDRISVNGALERRVVSN